MVAVANATDNKGPVTFKFTLTDVYHPLIHKLLRPVLTRASLGHDVDCYELLVALTSPQLRTVIVDEGQCKCCSDAGTWCITAIKYVYTWSNEMNGPIQEVAVRCLNCVVNHKFCDLPQRTRFPTCVCDWQIPPEDRVLLAKRDVLLQVAGKQLGLPSNDRIPDKDIANLFWRLRSVNEWFLQHAEMGYQMNLLALQPALKALGVQEVVRSDGRWIVPHRQHWRPCPCYLSAECGPERHFDVEVNDTGSDIQDELMDKELALDGEIDPDRSAEQWELVKGYAKHTPPKIVSLPNNELKLDDTPKKMRITSLGKNKGKGLDV